MSLLDPLRRPYRFRELHRRFGQRPFRLLDVGAGNHSASVAKLWFPNCHYAGIDRDRNYHNDEADFAAMDEFFELDLTKLEFGAIPDASYDAILLAHVIEHLENGDDVLRALAPKLSPGGILYAEFPGPQSLHFPSKRGTLNFHDDDTHVRVFDAKEVAGILRGCGLEVLRANTRRDLRGILLMPVFALRAKQRHGYVPGGVFWDLFGFADQVLARRPSAS
ncbi:MAG: class I SAM-dependent methyltransferase [Candidatus Eisenbacteria bacterium]